ncbi:MAG: hypothetical protein ABJA60_09525 [Nitrosospira sp.]
MGAAFKFISVLTDMISKNCPLETMLTIETVEPLSIEERARLGAEWADKMLLSLLAYAQSQPSFGEILCKKVIEKYGSDEKLGSLMLKYLRGGRAGKPKGARKTWNKTRYLSMLMHYEIRRAIWGREDALKWTGENEGIGVHGEQVFNPKKVESRITAARKIITDEELSRYLPNWIKNPPV